MRRGEKECEQLNVKCVWWDPWKLVEPWGAAPGVEGERK